MNGIANASTYCASASSLQDAIDNEDLTSVQITLLVNAGLVEEYTNGTPSSFGEGRVVLTTDEWNSLQTNGVSFQIKVESQEGTWVEEINSINYFYGGNGWHNYIPNKDDIIEINFIKDSKENIDNRYENSTTKVGIIDTDGSMTKVWIEDNILYAGSDGLIYSYSPEYLFQGFKNVETINLGNLRFSNEYGHYIINTYTFYGCEKLKRIDLSKINFDDFSVISFDSTFKECKELEEIIFPSNVILKIESMTSMFENCSKLVSLDLSTFDTSSMQNTAMYDSFNGCISLHTIYVSNLWDVSNHLSGMHIFGNNYSLVGGNGTPFDSAKTDKSVAIIDGTDNQDGYLTDIADKPTN